MGNRAILRMVCPDRKGLVADIAGFVSNHQGNILDADHHTDRSSNLFISRIEWEMNGFDLQEEEILPKFKSYLDQRSQAKVAIHSNHGLSTTEENKDSWVQLNFTNQKIRTAIWVTKQDHCLMDLLMRFRDSEIHASCDLIISNHPDLYEEIKHLGIPYHHIDMKSKPKKECEAEQLALLQEYNIDLVILAKYMQILSSDFVKQFPNIINIHHSFLPAFIGAKPYHQAYSRGVKLIGATAHYATSDLDQGPIISQAVIPVSHRDTIEDMVIKGKDIERTVLSQAVKMHCGRRVVVFNHKTVVFD